MFSGGSEDCLVTEDKQHPALLISAQLGTNHKSSKGQIFTGLHEICEYVILLSSVFLYHSQIFFGKKLIIDVLFIMNVVFQIIIININPKIIFSAAFQDVYQVGSLSLLEVNRLLYTR